MEHLQSGRVYSATINARRVMTMAIRGAQTAPGPHLGTAIVALAVAAACICLLVFLLSPIPGEATSSRGETRVHGHWDGSASQGGVKLIPI